MEKKFYNYLGFALAVAVLFPVAAWAAAIATPEGETAVKVNWGEPVAWALGYAATAIGALTAWAIGLLPGPARWVVKATQIDQVLNKKIADWVGKNRHRISSATLTVDLRNEAIRDIAVSALNSGNKFVIGARDQLAEMLGARLEEYLQKNFGSGNG